MTDLNHVVLIGRLTKDLGTDERSFGYVANGQARANVSIAVNRSRKNGEQWVDEVNYFDVTIWGKTAENLKPYLLKGKQIEKLFRMNKFNSDEAIMKFAKKLTKLGADDRLEEMGARQGDIVKILDYEFEFRN